MSFPRQSEAPMSAAEANRTLYGEIARTYDRSEECVVDERLRGRLRRSLGRAVDMTGRDAGSVRALDAGGGSGNASLLLLELGIRPLVVDVSPEMLAILGEKALALGQPPECMVADLGEFLMRDRRTWDLIVFSSVLHHLEDPLTVLRLARDRVGPGGVIVTMFDPTKAGILGARLRRVDYMLHVVLRTPGRLPRLLTKLPRRGAEAGLRSVGPLAERHATTGIDDFAIRGEFERAGWLVAEHDRRFESRFAVTRGLFRVLGRHSSFSFLLRAPLSGTGGVKPG